MAHTDQLMAAVVDSLDSQIAVIDREGRIVYVNQAWRNFSLQNGMPVTHKWEGINYMTVCNAAGGCGDCDGSEAAAGIRAVLENRSAAYMFEYPCHSPTEKRWFMMRITALRGMGDFFVISHHVITERKLAEERVEQANQELARLATTDTLTLLANRRKLDEMLASELHRVGRYESTFSLILLDVDHFKSVNDRFGHPAGDAILSGVAEILRTRVRESDVAGRWGGDEFMVLLPGCGQAAAQQMAEHLRRTIAEVNFAQVGMQTCSLGVATHVAGDTATTLTVRADAALYEAKCNGRNQVGVISMENDVGKPFPAA